MRWESKKHTAGFTLVELLLFTTIFAMVSVAFVSIFVVITRVQSREGSTINVNQESQFALQTIQRLVQESSLIEMEANQATTTVKLRMSEASQDPTYIYLSDSRLFVQETATGTAQPLTSNRVVLSNVSFTKRANPGGKDSLDVMFTMAARASTTQQIFSQAIDTSVARVSAASFDSDIRASGTTLGIGRTQGEWQSINDTLFFSGNKVGLNVSPGSGVANNSLEINGGLRLNDTNGVATSSLGCSSSVNRGTMWFIKNSGSQRDLLVVCLRNGSGTPETYEWFPLN